MITKHQIELWLEEGFDILQNGKPLKVEGDIWEYIENLNNEKEKIFVLREVVYWEDEELAKI